MDGLHPAVRGRRGPVSGDRAAEAGDGEGGRGHGLREGAGLQDAHTPHDGFCTTSGAAAGDLVAGGQRVPCLWPLLVQPGGAAEGRGDRVRADARWRWDMGRASLRGVCQAQLWRDLREGRRGVARLSPAVAGPGLPRALLDPGRGHDRVRGLGRRRAGRRGFRWLSDAREYSLLPGCVVLFGRCTSVCSRGAPRACLNPQIRALGAPPPAALHLWRLGGGLLGV
mmetsp:Transcript_37452/g.101398  ORF Transcript_37452/g.101398 Transcript_37452/m.101398 type:complete len:225 (+) Transcript_37452:410-1084(+)